MDDQNPWLPPLFPTAVLQQLPSWPQYRLPFIEDFVPVYEALHITSACIKLGFANGYCMVNHQVCQKSAASYVLSIVSNPKLYQQLTFPQFHTRHFWCTLFSLEASVTDSGLADYNVDDMCVHLQKPGFCPVSSIWWPHLSPYHEVFNGFHCIPTVTGALHLERLAGHITATPPSSPVHRMYTTPTQFTSEDRHETDIQGEDTNKGLGVSVYMGKNGILWG